MKLSEQTSIFHLRKFGHYDKIRIIEGKFYHEKIYCRA